MAITINNVRFSYCNLLQAVTKPGQTEAKFSVTVLVPKTNTAAKAAIDAAVQQAIEQGVSKCWNGVRPPLIAICVYDGDGQRPSDGMPFGEECKGMWVFTASSKAANPPEVVDANVQRIINPAEVYSGMWGNINVNFFPYANGGKKGIGCGLNCVQKTRDDEPLAGHVSAQEAFSAVQPQQTYAAPAAPQQPYTAPTAPAYPQPPVQPYAAPQQPAYQQPAAQPAYSYPQVDPITGQPMQQGGYQPNGMPIMGL